MTPEVCYLECSNLGHRYYGLKNGNECHCGSSPNFHGKFTGFQVSNNACNIPCQGDKSSRPKMCGGETTLSFYTTSKELQSCWIRFNFSVQHKMTWEQNHLSQNAMRRAKNGLNFIAASHQEHQCFQKMRKSILFYANSMETYVISIWKAAWTFVETFARTIMHLAMLIRNNDTIRNCN